MRRLPPRCRVEHLQQAEAPCPRDLKQCRPRTLKRAVLRNAVPFCCSNDGEGCQVQSSRSGQGEDRFLWEWSETTDTITQIKENRLTQSATRRSVYLDSTRRLLFGGLRSFIPPAPKQPSSLHPTSCGRVSIFPFSLSPALFPSWSSSKAQRLPTYGQIGPWLPAYHFHRS